MVTLGNRLGRAQCGHALRLAAKRPAQNSHSMRPTALPPATLYNRIRAPASRYSTVIVRVTTFSRDPSLAELVNSVMVTVPVVPSGSSTGMLKVARSGAD